MLNNQDFKLWNYRHDESLERDIHKNNQVKLIRYSLQAKRKEIVQKTTNNLRYH